MSLPREPRPPALLVALDALVAWAEARRERHRQARRSRLVGAIVETNGQCCSFWGSSSRPAQGDRFVVEADLGQDWRAVRLGGVTWGNGRAWLCEKGFEVVR